MNDAFRADPDQLARHAGQFDGLAERAGKIHADLRAALQSLGSPWGDDDAGRSFAGVHTGAADETLERLDALPGSLGDVGSRFTAAARTYTEADRTGAAGLTGTEQDG